MKRTIIIAVAALVALGTPSAVAQDIKGKTEQTQTKSQKKDRKAPKGKGEVKEVVFDVHLHCENCVKKVNENIAFEKGVKDLKVSLEDQTVAVKYDASKTSEETLRSAIEKLGYKASVKEGHGHDARDGKAPHGHGHQH